MTKSKINPQQKLIMEMSSENLYSAIILSLQYVEWRVELHKLSS